MLVKTRNFGEIDLDEDKIITFDHGIMGFEELKRYTILFDAEEGERSPISWLQSIDEEALSIPVLSPFVVKSDYNPVVEDELLKGLGEIREDNLIILLTMTVPTDVSLVSVNLKAPFIINSETRKGCQIIATNEDYDVKYNIYEVIQSLKEAKGDK